MTAHAQMQPSTKVPTMNTDHQLNSRREKARQKDGKFGRQPKPQAPALKKKQKATATPNNATAKDSTFTAIDPQDPEEQREFDGCDDYVAAGGDIESLRDAAGAAGDTDLVRLINDHLGETPAAASSEEIDALVDALNDYDGDDWYNDVAEWHDCIEIDREDDDTPSGDDILPIVGGGYVTSGGPNAPWVYIEPSKTVATADTAGAEASLTATEIQTLIAMRLSAIFQNHCDDIENGVAEDDLDGFSRHEANAAWILDCEVTEFDYEDVWSAPIDGVRRFSLTRELMVYVHAETGDILTDSEVSDLEDQLARKSAETRHR